MKIAVTGATGFVGRHLAGSLVSDGHEVVVIARGRDRRDTTILERPGVSVVSTTVGDVEALASAFVDCDAVAHCAGINRQIGNQTYARVHVGGTRAVIDAAKRSGVGKVVFLSFLRARPNCGLPYHESKWAAEEIVRGSGLDFTIIKAGVIYGRGDHMLDHLAHTFQTLPLFALVGMKDQQVAPLAVGDLVNVLKATLVGQLLSRETVSVTGPESMTLHEAVSRVARVTGKRPRFIRMPVWFHLILAWVLERMMTIPVVSLAQVHILSEGIVDRVAGCTELPSALAPRTPFSADQIQRGLPPLRRFGLSDLRCWVSGR